MFIPIGDQPNPSSTPWVTRFLIAINVAVFVLVTLPLDHGLSPTDLNDPATLSAIEELWNSQGEQLARRGVDLRSFVASLTVYDLFLTRWGYRPDQPTLMALIASMFLHGGLMHLAGNMLFLWIFGDNVEDRLGRIPYLLGYLLTGLGATLFFAWLTPDKSVTLVGASGAISGVLGFYLVWFPHNQVKVFIFLGLWFMDVVLIRALFVLLFYLVVDNLLPFFAGSSGGVAHGAHIGGFLAGVGLAYLWNFWRGKAPPPPLSRTRPLSAPRYETPADRFSRALHGGQFGAAASAFNELLDQPRPLPHSADISSFGQWLLHNERAAEARTVLRFFVGNYPRSPELAQVHLTLGLLALQDGRRPTARDHFLDALDLAASDSPLAAEARSHLRRLEA